MMTNDLKKELEQESKEPEALLELPPTLIDFLKNLSIDELKKYHIRIPICTGYDDSLTKQQLNDLVNKLEQLDVPYTLYLVPRDENAHAAYLEQHKETLAQVKTKDEDLDFNDDTILSEEECEQRKVLFIKKWRHTETYETASRRFDAYFNGTKSATVQPLLTNDVSAYHKTHPHLTREDIENHYLEETKDFLSWHKRTDLPNAPKNILLYRGSLPQILQNCRQNVDKIGETNQNGKFHTYYKDSCPRYQFKLTPPEKTNTIKQHSQTKKQKNDKNIHAVSISSSHNNNQHTNEVTQVAYQTNQQHNENNTKAIDVVAQDFNPHSARQSTKALPIVEINPNSTSQKRPRSNNNTPIDSSPEDTPPGSPEHTPSGSPIQTSNGSYLTLFGTLRPEVYRASREVTGEMCDRHVDPDTMGKTLASFLSACLENPVCRVSNHPLVVFKPQDRLEKNAQSVSQAAFEKRSSLSA